MYCISVTDTFKFTFKKEKKTTQVGVIKHEFHFLNEFYFNILGNAYKYFCWNAPSEQYWLDRIQEFSINPVPIYEYNSNFLSLYPEALIMRPQPAL